jgi:cob(I)alamin adenosyltransferase
VVKIYTKTGDDGTTGLLYGGRVRKDSVVMQITGTVDEGQAAMGLARAEAVPDSELDRLLTGLERDLYVLMAELTTDPSHRSKLTAGNTLVTAEMVDGLERHIDDLKDRYAMPTDFVVPGANRGLGRTGPGSHRGPPGRAAAGVGPDRGVAGRPVPQPLVRSVVGHGSLG